MRTLARLVVAGVVIAVAALVAVVGGGIGVSGGGLGGDCGGPVHQGQGFTGVSKVSTP